MPLLHLPDLTYPLKSLDNVCSPPPSPFTGKTPLSKFMRDSFSHGTLLGLLSVAIATVRRLMLLTKVLLKLSWPERKLVVNGNKHQLNIFPVVK